MSKKMLIDATHTEETRVAVVDEDRLDNFDYESSFRKQLKGSIFLAKVTRVEPSLQAAFVNFGGNRHGFLPFSEIHPDYFRIPIADREALIAEEQRAVEEEEEEEDTEASEENSSADNSSDENDSNEDDVEEVGGEDAVAPEDSDEELNANSADPAEDEDEDDNIGNRIEDDPEDTNGNVVVNESDSDGNSQNDQNDNRGRRGRGRGRFNRRGRYNNKKRMPANNRGVEVVGGDSVEGDRPMRSSLRKQYKIQEVVKRGQIMLIQVSKEERGNKGAAVSSYISLPGRYCVLMPNSPRGGGVSRKIASFTDRKRMREILKELKLPKGMSVIMRTAGVTRTKTEIKRDLDYLMRLWDSVRELTLKSTAPALIHEEANLIRRAIRDIYDRDVDEVQVAGEEGFHLAKDFMKMMIPSHVRRVKLYKDEKMPLFQRYQAEHQIMAIGESQVTLKSGGYLVINPTEALVSIDVNSGRATKERHIEETALHTNLEAAEEVARQLRLRDLGGLVVIDFIDMEDRRNNYKVEKKLKEALSTDRARIQVGRISNFGLLELSRQRLNPSLTEAQFERCDHCDGVGYVRSVDSTAINALRALEAEGVKDRAEQVALSIPNRVAIYILNNKRTMLAEIEERYGFKVLINVNEDLAPSSYAIEPVKSQEDNSDNDGDDDQDDNQSRNRKRKRNDGRNDDRRGNRSQNNRRGGRRDNRDNRYNRDERMSDSDKSDTNPEPVTETPVETKAEAKSEAPVAKEEKKEKPKRAPRKSAKKKEEEKAEPAEQSTPKEESKPARPSNDDAKPKPPADYEKVNEQPTEKKRGWWSKATD